MRWVKRNAASAAKKGRRAVCPFARNVCNTHATDAMIRRWAAAGDAVCASMNEGRHTHFYTLCLRAFKLTSAGGSIIITWYLCL